MDNQGDEDNGEKADGVDESSSSPKLSHPNPLLVQEHVVEHSEEEEGNNSEKRDGELYKHVSGCKEHSEKKDADDAATGGALLSAPGDTHLGGDEKETGWLHELNKEDIDHLPGLEGNVVGSLAGDGSKLLNMDLSTESRRFHCFTVTEIKHVLQRKEPTTLCVPGLERLHKASEIHYLISGKLKSSKGWRCPNVKTMHCLCEINKEMDTLKDRLLPKVTPKWWKTPSPGNTRATSKVIQKAKDIRKLAKALQKNKKVIGELIGGELCRIIKNEPPLYLKENAPELIQMVKDEQDKPVWFYR